MNFKAVIGSNFSSKIQTKRGDVATLMVWKVPGVKKTVEVEAENLGDARRQIARENPGMEILHLRVA